MFKKLLRLTLSLVFGMLILANLSLAFAANSAIKAESASGTEYTSAGGKHVCICSGDDCRPCADIKEE